MNPSAKFKTLYLVAAMAGGFSHGVIINDHSTSNFAPAAPANFPWDNTAFGLNGAAATATYLGNGWAITATHAFGANNDLEIAGAHYTWDQSINGGLGYFPLNDGGQELDFRLFRVNEPVPIPGVTIAQGPLSLGENLTISGTGNYGIHNPGATAAVSDDYFTWAGSRVKSDGIHHDTHWGTNTIETINSPASGASIFTTNFAAPDDPSATIYEAQMSNGDSGANAYVLRGGVYELVGMLVSVDGKSIGRTFYGHDSTYLDLTVYREELENLTGIPEPSSALLIAITGMLSILRRRK